MSDNQDVYYDSGDYLTPDEIRALHRSERQRKWKEENRDKNKARDITYNRGHRSERAKQKRDARTDDYLARLFVAIDFEGQDYTKEQGYPPIYREYFQGSKPIHIPYDEHRLFIGGAAPADQSRDPDWLIHPDTTDPDKKPLDPRAVLQWLVSLPEKFGDDAIYVMYSFSYDVTHILRFLRFEKAWEVFKGETYDKDRTKRRKIRGRVFCGRPFDEFCMTYRNRKQLDIWKLRNPEKPYLRDDKGGFITDKKTGIKQLDCVAHITIFDTHHSFNSPSSTLPNFLLR